VALQTRDDALGWVATLATGTVSAAGAREVVLTLAEPVGLVADETPILAVEVQRQGLPPRLLSASARAEFGCCRATG